MKMIARTIGATVAAVAGSLMLVAAAPGAGAGGADLATVKKDVAKAEAASDGVMDRLKLSDRDKRYVQAYVKNQWTAKIPDSAKPTLDIGQVIRKGDIGTPCYRGVAGNVITLLVIDQILGPGEVVVRGGPPSRLRYVRLSGVKTNGMSRGGRTDMKRLYYVGDVCDYVTATGERVKTPCLSPVDDVGKIREALKAKEVVAWIGLTAKQQEAETRASISRLAADALQKKAALAMAESERKKAEKAQEQDYDGLVLLGHTLGGVSDRFGGTITGTIVNRRKKNLRYVEIKIDLYDEDGAKVGTATGSLGGLEAGEVWKFKAVTFTPFQKYKVSGVRGN